MISPPKNPKRLALASSVPNLRRWVGWDQEDFSKREEALAYFEQCKVQQENNFGAATLNMPESLRVEALECAERLEAFGATLREATEFYITHLQKIS